MLEKGTRPSWSVTPIYPRPRSDQWRTKGKANFEEVRLRGLQEQVSGLERPQGVRLRLSPELACPSGRREEGGLTQRARVLSDLSSGKWVCGSRWLSSYLYVYSQRISEINAETPSMPRILSRPCQQHDHPVFEYLDTKAAAPRQLVLEVA